MEQEAGAGPVSEPQVLQKGLRHCVSKENIFRGSCASGIVAV